MPAAQSARASATKTDDTLLREVVEGLSQVHKQLPSKYFYDSAGSRYFDEICQLEEYYPYRTELAMLPGIADDLSHLIRDQRDVVEFGAGSLVKIRLLLQHLPQIKRLLPIDIAGDHLREAAAELRREFEHLEIVPIVADFTRQVELPDRNKVKKLGFFPGSTIGNFTPLQAVAFLDRARRSLGAGALLLIGVDTKKAPEILHRAYNDKLGVTAKFNRNILTHINREAGGDFDEDKFDHYAFYNPTQGRIEMHLISREQQVVTVEDYQFAFSKGENIHTENSHKYTPEEFLTLAAEAGWRGVRKWLDDEELFCVHLLQAGG
ncbi:L-histidine N(alpha)-methyltransferase [Exilibacterium tricleocarpae]|uniref:L-histidine N(Alpha)-methyltransferase n=1 Tax=Exilibacterium tricleocarpae TaxID=2591008 RepID=A0A545T3N0_9GAMM|nr:L-histidine N(alpha)-methyltransferase [Exilibacterium tricleocarpae]TQV71827.1 L-histidine N(alpha)-methyltransferase [Exilibacterium tricleocarpae]